MDAKVSRRELADVVGELSWVRPGVGEMFFAEDDALVLIAAARVLLDMKPASDEEIYAALRTAVKRPNMGQWSLSDAHTGYRSAEAHLLSKVGE